MLFFNIFSIALWVLTLLSIMGYNLLRRIDKQEKIIKDYESIIENQNTLLLGIRDTLKESSKVLKNFDERGIYRSDDETGTFFKMITGIQDILNEFFSK